MEQRDLTLDTDMDRCLTDDSIWKKHCGPKHSVLTDNDCSYWRYVEMLYTKLVKFSSKSHKHSVGYCNGCFSFITLQGKERTELGHPQELWTTMKKLFKKEEITDVKTFVEWNKRSTFAIEVKGKRCKRHLVPVVNRYHRSTEYDGLDDKTQKRQYVVNLEAKVRTLETENAKLKRRLLEYEMNELSTPGLDSLKKLK